MHCSFDSYRFDFETAKKFTLHFLLALLLIVNVLSTLFNFYCKNNMQLINKSETITNNTLNNIDALVKELFTNLQQQNRLSQQQQTSVRNQLVKMQKTMDQLPTANDLLQIQKQLDQINQQIKLLNKQNREKINNQQRKKPSHSNFKKYPVPNVLPFTVTGVVRVDEYERAEIDMNGRDEYIAKGATCSGWKVVDISFEPAQVVLKNINGYNKTVTVRLA